jgi:hypothetical protein
MNSTKFPTDILKKLVLNTPNTYFYGFWFDQINCELEQLDDLFSKDPSENNLSYQKKQQMLNFIAQMRNFMFYINKNYLSDTTLKIKKIQNNILGNINCI